jgi:Zn-dependent membrane protease YugP
MKDIPMFMMFDPIHSLIMLSGLPLVMLPQLWVKNTFNRVSKIPNKRGITGAYVAQQMLLRHQITTVAVEETPHYLGDHYSPDEHMIRLSPDVFRGSSIAAVAIAAHEVGHAIQHATEYRPVVWRSKLFPAVSIGSQVGPLLLMGSFVLSIMAKGFSEFAFQIGVIGVCIFSVAVLFHFVTLPVEIDASLRALKVLKQDNFLFEDELPQAKKVLTSAAFTYTATALYALLELAGYVYRLLAMSSQSQDE